MTTKSLDNKICTFKIYCRGVSHEKQRFGRFSSLPPSPPPPKTKFYFYRRLAVSEIHTNHSNFWFARITPLSCGAQPTTWGRSLSGFCKKTPLLKSLVLVPNQRSSGAKKGHKHKEFGQNPPPPPRPPPKRKIFMFGASFTFKIQEKGLHKEFRGWGVLEAQ